MKKRVVKKLLAGVLSLAFVFTAGMTSYAEKTVNEVRNVEAFAEGEIYFNVRMAGASKGCELGVAEEGVITLGNETQEDFKLSDYELKMEESSATGMVEMKITNDDKVDVIKAGEQASVTFQCKVNADCKADSVTMKAQLLTKDGRVATESNEAKVWLFVIQDDVLKYNDSTKEDSYRLRFDLSGEDIDYCGPDMSGAGSDVLTSLKRNGEIQYYIRSACSVNFECYFNKGVFGTIELIPETAGEVTVWDDEIPEWPHFSVTLNQPATLKIRSQASDESEGNLPEDSSKLPEEKVEESVKEITDAKAGTTVKVDMEKATVVPADVLRAAKGKDVKVVLQMNGYSWTISGKDITDSELKDINLAVIFNTKNIPSDVTKQLAGDKKTMQLSLVHEGEFGFKAVLTVQTGKDNVGKYANLFYYNKNGKLEFIDADQVNENGEAVLTFSHASDYVIVFDNKAANQDETSPKTSPKTGDAGVVETYAVLLVAVGIVIVLHEKRRNYGV